MYKLDRTAFKAMTADKADKEMRKFYKTVSVEERLRISMYLNSIAYNFPLKSPPKMDKTVFKAIARNGEYFQQRFSGFYRAVQKFWCVKPDYKD